MTAVVVCGAPTPLRRTLAERLAAVGEVTSVRLADDASRLFALLDSAPVDVVMLSSGLADARSASVVRMIRQKSPGTRVLLLTMGTDPDDVVAGMAAGAAGYLARDAAAAEAAAALALLPDGGAAPEQGPASAARSDLTERELQVLQGMSRGRSNSQIGEDLFLSEDTIKTHARRLFRKMRVNDRAHAVAEGFRQGLLD